MSPTLYPDPDDELDVSEYGDGDCPACHDVDLDEYWDVDKRGDRFQVLYCPGCGYEESSL